MKNSVCCVIITYNIGKKFEECYMSIKDQVEKIVIVDNGSDKETINYIKTLEKDNSVEVIYNQKNMGIAFALNQGCKIAIKRSYDWILTMDNDSIADANMVEEMLTFYKNLNVNYKEKIVSLFPMYFERSLKNKQLNYDKNDDSLEFVVAEITSGNLIKSNIIEEAGYFKEEFFIDYVDHEFCLRISLLGYKMVRVKSAKLFHKLGNMKSTIVLNKEITCLNYPPIRLYYKFRNRIYIWRKYTFKFPRFVIKDINSSIKEIVKIYLLEENSKEKLKMCFIGMKDFFRNKYGEYKL